MRVLIGILSNEAARYAAFWGCMMQLVVPEGSVRDVAIGTDYVGNRNLLAQRCLDEGFDWAWFVDDDHTFAANLLDKLLTSGRAFDLPILVPLCTTRRAPFSLVDYGRNPDPVGPDYLSVSLKDVPAEGIIELDAAGTAGMLIRRDVFEAMPQPWFENSPRSEDIVFCEKAIAAGFKIHADLACRLGHILTATVTPGYTGDGWVTGVVMGGLQFAIGTSEELEAEAEEEEDDYYYREGDAQPDLTLSEPVPATENPMIEPPSEAERIEIWVDEEAVWHWRAIGHGGAVLVKDSAINESSVLAAAELRYPGVMAYQIQREVDDSRDIRQYRVPRRMFDT